MVNTEFLGNLQQAGVSLVLHGDVHELRRDHIAHWHERKDLMNIVGAGSFGATKEARPESTPRLYNLLEIDRTLKRVRVHTRQQPKLNGPWKGWNEWPDPDGGKGFVPFFEIKW